ncbi:MAG: acyl-CoA dehydrogenase family protein [Thermoplasmataceae archaeon]
MNEEQDILRSAAVEFIRRHIEPNEIQLERSGISRELVSELAAQGFLGAAPPEKLGGSGVSLSGYLTILEEFGKACPSVAVYLMLTNSLIPRLLGESYSDQLADVFSGRKIMSVYLNPVLDHEINANLAKVSNSTISGTMRNFMAPWCDSFIVPEETSRELYLVNARPDVITSNIPFTLRPLGIQDVAFKTTNFKPLGKNLDDLLVAVESLDAEIASILLGISRGSIEKATGYTQVRTTFGEKLKDFSPVAYRLSELHSELDIAENYLSGIESGSADPLKIKIKAISLAKEAAKYSLQFHGGYGYFEDFGVERYYRDSMGIPILFANRDRDMQRLAASVFGSRSGFI